VLQQTLPAAVFALLLQNLDLAQKKVPRASKTSKKGGVFLEELE